jgi:hypothetical protein
MIQVEYVVKIVKQSAAQRVRHTPKTPALAHAAAAMAMGICRQG